VLAQPREVRIYWLGFQLVGILGLQVFVYLVDIFSSPLKTILAVRVSNVLMVPFPLLHAAHVDNPRRTVCQQSSQ
jgi:hypothetical protein